MPNSNTPSSLDLYAKVEDLLGVKEVAPKLYAHYLLALYGREFDALLDVGCGDGDFIQRMQEALNIPKIKGIDLSPIMVAKTQALGYEAEIIALESEKGSYDVITAVFDMLNYLDPIALKSFLDSVSRHLNQGGVFLCDINTLYGFEEVAVGAYIVDDEERFLTIDSEFESGVYHSTFTLFEMKQKGFKKSKATINQYYHTVEEMVEASGLTLVTQEEISLYELGESDKLFLVFGKK